MKVRNLFGKGELAVSIFCMKMLCFWPEKQLTSWKKVYCYIQPVPALVFACFVWTYFLTEAKDDGMTNVLQSFTDGLGVLSFAVKGVSVLRHNVEIYDIFRMLSEDFGSLQNKVRGVRIQRPLAVWTPCIIFLFQCFISVAVSIHTMTEPPEIREPSLRMPSALVKNDFYFTTLMILYAITHWCCYFMNTAWEALLINLTTTICEKAETLKKMILHWNDDRYPSDVEKNAELDRLIYYHVLLADLRNRIERIFTKSIMYQICFMIVSLGSPGIRIIMEELKTGVLGFMISYVVWVSAQLIVYCMVCDEATNSCTQIAFVAYSVYQPAMAPPLTKKLIMIMTRAQRPMHITANGLIKINRRTLLMVYKQSYRFYSAVLNLK